MPEIEEETTTKEEEAPEAADFTAEDKAAFVAELKKKNSEAKNLRDRLNAAETQLQEIADKDKTVVDKATERVTALEAENKRLVKEAIGYRHGLNEAQIKRLVGDTPDELEADAAELVETLGIKPADPVLGKPREAMPRGGGDPDQQVEETDPAKLAAAVPRSAF